MSGSFLDANASFVVRNDLVSVWLFCKQSHVFACTRPTGSTQAASTRKVLGVAQSHPNTEQGENLNSWASCFPLTLTGTRLSWAHMLLSSWVDVNKTTWLPSKQLSGRARLDRPSRSRVHFLSMIGKYFLFVRTGIGVPQIDVHGQWLRKLFWIFSHLHDLTSPVPRISRPFLYGFTWFKRHFYRISVQKPHSASYGFLAIFSLLNPAVYSQRHLIIAHLHTKCCKGWILKDRFCTGGRGLGLHGCIGYPTDSPNSGPCRCLNCAPSNLPCQCAPYRTNQYPTHFCVGYLVWLSTLHQILEMSGDFFVISIWLRF